MKRGGLVKSLDVMILPKMAIGRGNKQVREGEYTRSFFILPPLWFYLWYIPPLDYSRCLLSLRREAHQPKRIPLGIAA